MIEVGNDRQMILTPSEWPMFYLPLKRPKGDGGWPDIALLRSASTDPNAERIVEENRSLYGDIGPITEHKYATVDALLADGWVVD